MLTLVVYVPGAGGNHLKNLLCASGCYANSSDLDPAVYHSPNTERPPGEVWCVGGRNLQPIFFNRMTSDTAQHWVLAAHIGEMLHYHTQLSAIEYKKIIVVTLDNEHARRQLDQRQLRLGQCIHPYWLDEELSSMYRPETLSKLFVNSTDQYFNLCLGNFWNPNFVSDRSFNDLMIFLNIDMDRVSADQYHRLWCAVNNFV